MIDYNKLMSFVNAVDKTHHVEVTSKGINLIEDVPEIEESDVEVLDKDGEILTEEKLINDGKPIPKVIIVTPMVFPTKEVYDQEYEKYKIDIQEKLHQCGIDVSDIVESYYDRSQLSEFQFFADIIYRLRDADYIYLAKNWEQDTVCKVVHGIAIFFNKGVLFSN